MVGGEGGFLYKHNSLHASAAYIGIAIVYPKTEIRVLSRPQPVFCAQQFSDRLSFGGGG